MNNEGWYLKPISSFIYLLDKHSRQNQNILQKRFKKDESGLIDLFLLINQIDSFGYDKGIEFAFATERFKWIKGTKLHVLEIRKFHKTWRVITYLDKTRKKLIMLDAFEAHKSKPMNKKLDEISPLVDITKKLLKEEGK